MSWEKVVAADPQCIIINDYGTPTARQKEHFLETSKITRNLTAVKNKCFLPLAYDQITPGPRNADAVTAIARCCTRRRSASRRSRAACGGYGAPCIPPRDQRCPDPRRDHLLALPPGAELVFQPRRRMRLLDGASLGQELARPQGVAAACHRRQPQVGDHRVQPPQRPPRRARPVPAQLGARGAADLVAGHVRQHSGWRAAQDSEAVPDELGPRDPRQDALDQRSVGPRGVQRLVVGQPAGSTYTQPRSSP